MRLFYGSFQTLCNVAIHFPNSTWLGKGTFNVYQFTKKENWFTVTIILLVYFDLSLVYLHDIHYDANQGVVVLFHANLMAWVARVIVARVWKVFTRKTFATYYNVTLLSIIFVHYLLPVVGISATTITFIVE